MLNSKSSREIVLVTAVRSDNRMDSNRKGWIIRIVISQVQLFTGMKQLESRQWKLTHYPMVSPRSCLEA